MWTPARAAKTIDACLAWREQGQAPPMLIALCTFYRLCYQGFIQIRDIHGEMVPLIPNQTQEVVLAAMMAQAWHGRPIRLRILKSRKHGISTLIQALKYVLCKLIPRQVAQLYANQAKSTDEIFEIAKLVAEHDVLGAPKVIDREIKFEAMGSRYECHTAGSGAKDREGGAAVGGTPNLVHNSEVALWQGDKRSIMAAILNAVPYVPESMIVDESTARGREYFWQSFQAAFEPNNPYEPIFLPWFCNDDNRLPTTETITRDKDEQDVAELALKDYGLVIDDAQLAWRRMKINELGHILFKREHPATPEEAVSSAEGLVLPSLNRCIVDGDTPWTPNQCEPYEERVGGMDFGWHDPTVIVDGIYKQGVLRIIGLYRAKQKTTPEDAAELQILHRYYCDPSATQQRQDMLQLVENVELVPAPRLKDDTHSIAEWRLVEEWARCGRIQIERAVADQFMVEADSLMWNETTGKPDKYRDEDVGHFDTLDALRYCVIGLAQADMVSLPSTRREKRQPSRWRAMREL